MWLLRDKTSLVDPERALPGRAEAIIDPDHPHEVLFAPIRPELAAGHERIVVGLGCFWGAERLFWSLPGVVSTAAAYAGGFTENPTYEEVCSGRTGHTEVVEITFDPSRIALSEILRVFWESHDPTQGMRQGNDVGTQYRSAIYTTTEAQLAEARASRDAYQDALRVAGRGAVTTEVLLLEHSYLAESYHQQYLHKVPHGYCGLRGTGVSCPIPG